MGIEIEKKFLLKYHPHKDLCNPQRLIQGYIKKDKKSVVRIRVTDTKGFLTIKGPKTNNAGLEFEYEIPKPDAETLIRTLCQKPVIDKNRYHVIHNNSEWVIDEFFNENAGLMIAEIELESAEQAFEKPDWVGEEVTHDPRYYNSNLIEHPFSKW